MKPGEIGRLSKRGSGCSNTEPDASTIDFHSIAPQTQLDCGSQALLLSTMRRSNLDTLRRRQNATAGHACRVHYRTKLKSVLLEGLVESPDTRCVEALSGEKHAHGNSEQRFHRVNRAHSSTLI